MADITLTSAVRNNLLSLQNTADLLGRTQERLATGNKVNSALDDPTAFFTASALDSRASDLNRLLDSVGLGIQTLEAADAGISALSDLVEQAQATVRQALQTTGRTTTSQVVGAATANFNPQALTTITGNGGTATNADASASVQGTGNLGADAANAVATGADIGDDTDALSTFGVSVGDSLVITNGTTAHTITFDANTVANVTGNDFTIGIDQDLDAFVAAINDADFTGVTATATDGVIEITAQASDDTLRIQDGAQGTVTAELGFGAVGIGADTTNRLFSKNTALDDLVNAGRTLQVQLGSGATTTLTFGTAAGNVQTKADLISQVNAISGVTATETGTNQITVATTDTNDADSAVKFTVSNADVFIAIGLTADAGTPLVSTASPTNLLSAGNGLTTGDTLTIQIGSQSNTITFGNGSGQVSTLRELNTTLNAISSGSLSVAESGAAIGNISITNNNPADSIRVSGSTGTAARFGLTEGEFSNIVNGASGPVQQGDTLTLQVGTNSALTITFGTGANQVNTTAELTAQLGSLSGGTATLDTTTGAITVTATNTADSITVTDSTPARSAAAFGLTPGATAPVTTDSTERAEFETQFNTLLDQIDLLARDASFNGNNLLQSDNLKVILNEGGTSTLSIKGVDFDSGGLGINRAATDAFQTDTSLDATLVELDTAIRTLRTQASTFGSNLSIVETREQFTKELSNVLETGAANLTLADLNEEGANLLALQTRQQLSSVALSLASQADQQVLRLF